MANSGTRDHRPTGVYAIVHKGSGRAYVGGSCDVRRRWNAHARLLNRGCHASGLLQSLWTREGPDAFLFVLLERCEVGDISHREEGWLTAFANPFNTVRHNHRARLLPDQRLPYRRRDSSRHRCSALCRRSRVLYARGLSCKAVARRIKRTGPTVSRLLRLHQLLIRRNNSVSPQVRRLQLRKAEKRRGIAQRMWRAGYGWRHIAQKLDVGYMRVRQLLGKRVPGERTRRGDVRPG